ncbi:MAG: TM2 domain-containing protein [Planctomycetes bacterium]|nr:TM2 domain-containing protein [Planctomycetota bacterium]
MEGKLTEEKKEGKVSEKNRLIAFILCIVLGWAGGHRFYVNKTGTGLLMLLLAGVLGIWWFIDLILVSIGAFKDKENLPVEKWT